MSRDGHTVGEGQYFGEAAFLRGHPRAETATALEELVVIVLDSKDLASFIECVEEAAPIFSDFVWRKSAQALHKIPFFESVPRDKLEQIAHLCKYRTFATDEVIVRAGDPGTDFYVIESGRVRVEVPSDPAQMMAAAAATAMRGGNKSAYSRREELEARRRAFANSKGSPDDEHPMKYVYLGENEYFGEIAVLASEPRSATVRVMEGPCRCLILDGAAFRAFLTDCPQIKRDVVEKVTRRLRKASPEIRDSMKRSSRNLGSLTHMGASRDVRRSASRSSSVSSTFSSARSSVSSFRNEATEIEWITAPVESLASIPRGEDVMADQESIDAATVLFRVGETMGDCHLIYECWPIYVHPCSRPDLWGASTDVFVKLVGVDNQMRETTVKSHTDDTVADVVDKAFQMADKMGRNIDPSGGPNFFGLKVKSLNDFLVYREIPLRQYKYIAAKCQPGRRNHITLALVDLRRPPSSNGSGVHALSFLKQRSTPGRQNTSALEPAHGVPVHRRWASASAASSSLLPASSMSTSSSTTSNSAAAALAATASGPGPLKPPVSIGDATKRRTLSHLPLGRPQLTKQNSRGSSRTLSADSGSSVSSQEMAPPAISVADVADNRGDVIPEDASLQVPPPPPLSSHADAPTNGEGNENEISVTMATPGKPSIAPEEFSKLMLSMTQESLAIKPTWDEVQRGQQSPCEGPWPLRVRIVGLEGLLSPPSAFAEMDHVLGLRVQLVYASRVLETREISHFFRFKAKAASVRLDQWVSFNTTMDHLPLTTRLCFTLYNAAAMSKVAVSSSGAGAGAGGLGTGASGANGSTPGPVSPLYSGPGSSMDLSMYAWSSNVSSQDLGPALAMAQIAPSQMPLDADHAVVAGASLQLFDQRHIFRAGSQSALLWPGKAEKHLACMNRFPEFQDQARLQLELDEFRKPLYFALPPPIRVSISGLRTPDPKGMRGRNFGESSDQTERNASNADASGSKQRKSRRGVGVSPKRTKKPSILTRFKLASGNSTSVAAGSTTSSEEGNGKDQLTSDRANPADWCDPLQREMALEIAGQWQVPEPMEALELLDSCHGDLRVREYAVRCLEPLTDEDLGELLIQLTQAIKYEPYHESFLVRFLLRRAWQSPREIGTKLFWSLRSEMHNPRVRPRFGLILRVYLECASPAHRQDLSQEVDVQNLLKEVADAVQRQKGSSRADRHAFAQTELSKVSDQLPGSFQLCLDPRLVVRKLQVKECKVMNSKKKPLWLKFSSVDPAEGGGEPTLIMFKAGDDLRQDQMTLQMLRLMDKMWLGDGLDLCMTPYRCISTGNELGMIEVVTNSETTANIQKRHGKLGALSSRTLYEWLQDCNRGGSNFNDVRDRFVRSCAGYVVATYVLGIGDRHSDNIMLNRDGRLFHIDFGHFLGHFKSKYGVKRERTAFVFTKEMAAVMGGKNDKTFSEFVKLCCRAYNILRRHGNTLVNLFRLMVPAGMPELTSDDSILYLCQKLCLEMTEQEASESFKREIQSALGDTYRRFDNLIHNIKT
ncbi:Phosphatidylinositol 3-kinase, putative [Hondaea fermentalgiana]|uniref:phosphatidylinositol 3-kinase n=1 Tax=Hondaea fermentalgiana TaxID=2315210 RepID=A0A2R5GHA8_9STRA|nr:Phosphatidylinositol 3-kinase, putative [Hondaea fermentalgiana]|eukprot:GBG30282.1 Phosphatidylinositol 3-kinase, putative [Hondaea fermentalgiana]